MAHLLSPTRAALLAVLALLGAASPAFGVVYVNMQMDPNTQGFKVLPLDLEGESLTLDRMYQNEYGDSLDLEPGPPFIFEAPVYIRSIRAANGEVEQWSSLTIRNDQFNPGTPFQVQFSDPLDLYNEVLFYVDGDFRVEGMAFDEVKFEGPYRIRSYSAQFSDSVTENSFDIRFLHADFSQTSSSSLPMYFRGGHVSFENCIIKHLSGAYPWAILAEFSLVGVPAQWSFSMRGCGILNNGVDGYRVIYVQNAAKTTIEDNYFDNNTFATSPYPCLLELEGCGITRIDDNSCGSNTVNAFRFNTCFADTTAYIQMSPDLPLLVTRLHIDPDRVLTIDDGSILKFYNYQCGISNQGTTHIKNAVLTSSADDAYGGDTDVQPPPAVIGPWYHSLNGNSAGGVINDSIGTMLLENTRIRYAKTGTHSRATAIIDGCTYENCTLCGIHLNPRGSHDFIVRNTTVTRGRTDGVTGIEAALRIDDLAGSQADIVLDSVALIGNNMRGIWLNSSGNSAATNVILQHSRIAGNTGIGLQLALNNPAAHIQIASCLVAANNGAGIYAPGSATGPLLDVYNTVIAGNGYGGVADRNGINVGTGVLNFSGNTVARNYYRGLNIAGLSATGTSRIVNNNFLRNGDHGLNQTTSRSPVCAYNDFWSNSYGELYYYTGTTTLSTVEALQALGGEYATNRRIDPGLRTEQTGTIVAVTYDTLLARSSLIASPSSLSGWIHDTALVCPDTLDQLWFLVTERRGDTLIAVGDIRGKGQPGDAFRLWDYHLTAGSALIDSGGPAYAGGGLDCEGNQRVLDGDRSDGPRVDIGAHEFNPDSTAILVTAPTAGELFNPGDTCRIKWTCRYADEVSLNYHVHPDSIPVEIALHQAATPGSYDWIVPDSLISGLCRVIISSDGGAYGQSDFFGIKTSLLARRTTLGDFEAFRIGEDGWQFANDSASMWPESYFSTIDYVAGIDPNTGLVYPPLFASPSGCNARSRDFPDWQTWVRAFGVDQCYIQTPVGRIYDATALALWAECKRPKWHGSCFGLALLSMLAFDDPGACTAALPDLGSFVNLHDLTITDARRNVINAAWAKQLGVENQANADTSVYLSPTVVLQRCRAMLDTLSSSLGTNAITICAWPATGGGGCHAVTPYAVIPDPLFPNQWLICVYDNNRPDSIGFVIEVDTAVGAWAYAPFGWTNINHLVLEDPIENYKRPAVLQSALNPGAVTHQKAAGARISVYVQGAENYTLSGPAGEALRHADTIAVDSPFGRPLATRSGPDSPFLGFRLDTDEWLGRFGQMADSMLRVLIDAGDIFTQAVVAADTDSLTGHLAWSKTDKGLTLANTGADRPAATLRQICTLPDSQIVVELSGSFPSANDSVTIDILEDIGVRFINRGGPDTCLFRLQIASSSRCGEFVDSALIIPAQTAYSFAPRYENLVNNQLRVFVDDGADGTIDDSILIHNSLPTDIDQQGAVDILPDRFALSQNYPNPFNPATTIEYSLPIRCRVTVDVLNVLGQSVRSLVDRDQPAGEHSIVWDGKDEHGLPVATGIYLYRLRAGNYVETKKMLLLR